MSAITKTDATTNWELRSSAALRDFTLKKIAVIIIALFNLGAIGAGLYYIVSYFPVPTHALWISPLIVGVLGGLAYWKFPTLGISKHNYAEFSNPAALLARAISYVFMGPYMYALKKIDWTAYHDPIRAKVISDEIEKLPFKEVGKKYGKHFSNLIKYGFIEKEYQEKMVVLYKDFLPIKRALKFWKCEMGVESEKYKAEHAKLDSLEKRWTELKANFALPEPQVPDEDLSKLSTRISHFFRRYFIYKPPLERLSPF